MDEYAKFSLILFFPFRKVTDLAINNSFRLKFITNDVQNVIGERGRTILENMQDIRNNMHLSVPEDPLVASTQIYGKDKDAKKVSHFETCMQEELDLLHDIGEEDAAACMTNPFHSYCLDETSLSFAQLEVKGRKGIAKRHVSSIKFVPNENFLSNEDDQIALVREEASKKKSVHRSCPTLETLISVAAQRKVRRVKINEKDVSVLAPNGTAGSVIDWAKK